MASATRSSSFPGLSFSSSAQRFPRAASPSARRRSYFPALRCAGLLDIVRSRSGQPCSPFEAGTLPVLRPARPRFRFGLTRAPHESPTSGGYRRIHIRLRGRVLRNSPPPASVRSANRPEPWPRLAPSGVRRGARGLGLSPAPCASAPVVFAAIRAAMLRRRIHLLALRRVSPRIRRTASPHVAQFGTRPLVPCITFHKVRFLRSFCARRRSVSSLNLARVSPGAKRSRRRRAQCGVQIRRDFVRTIISFHRALIF